MGKANRPLVVRVHPGESDADALKRAQNHPRFKNRKRSRVMVIREFTDGTLRGKK